MPTVEIPRFGKIITQPQCLCGMRGSFYAFMYPTIISGIFNEKSPPGASEGLWWAIIGVPLLGMFVPKLGMLFHIPEYTKYGILYGQRPVGHQPLNRRPECGD